MDRAQVFEYVDLFRRLLTEASTAVGRAYFLLPVSHAESGSVEQYRERVYAYELYHQLRMRWPDRWPYWLGGEHTLVRAVRSTTRNLI